MATMSFRGPASNISQFARRSEILETQGCSLDDSVPMNTKDWITPKAIQHLLDELETSKQSQLRAWNEYSNGSGQFSPRLETLPSYPRPRKRSMPSGKPWNML